ncbi:SDR family NAD(P)-dependent oxidoreductase [Novosphingobium sp. P6W]|uniref:SDR family NAD(P)-dependent oxidoreductase n=1 Tax=Novosphingobium sp. P6W TaxID=1609758 RepID=UPI0005C31117|nr:SDR family oxidoreductase [Novosphingobium sp. P6W]AXB80331.1 SDR family NAD(P)-dependent oxidoreductase [Novosphingobium sp. P6W]KIS31661.1 3-oxoacyl-ACP reductase [Novosphingobium sp. P6W]
MQELKGKVALVTGAGQGIGQGVAMAFASAGIDLVLAGRTLEKVEGTADMARARGVLALPLACNVREPDDLVAAVERAVQELGGVDILVNNAQEVPLGRLDEVTDDAFMAGFESGPLASFRLMKLVRPSMRSRGGGTIFNFASSAGIRWDMAGYGCYGASKEAIRVLTRAAASEWGREGIRVLTIAPHAGSPALQAWVENNPDEATTFFRSIPLGRIGDVELDIGRAVVALCRHDLEYLTGATIPLDGGQANF